MTTVAELRKQLEQFPDDMEVFVEYEGYGYNATLNDIELCPIKVGNLKSSNGKVLDTLEILEHDVTKDHKNKLQDLVVNIRDAVLINASAHV